MQRDGRSSVWLRRLVAGLAVVILVLGDFGAALVGAPPVHAAGQRDEAGPSTSPGSVRTSSYTAYLPLVARPPTQVPSVFGTMIYDALNSSGAALDLAQGAGLTWVRWPFGWRDIEPSDTTPEHYNWARTDASFAAAKTAGLNVIATMMNNPSWAASNLNGRLDRLGVEPLVQFMAAVVERYDGDGKGDAPGSPVVNYWELYNEPDNGDPMRGRYAGIGYWGPYGKDYARMLCAVYPAVKAASPNAKIVLGGLAYDWFQEDGGPFVRAFLDDVLNAGGGRCLDAVAFHYYVPLEAVWAPYGPGLSGKANYLRGKLNAHGLTNLPLLVTEAGHHSNDDDPRWPSTPEIQSGYVIKLFTQAIASNIPVMIWWSWVDLPNYWAATGLLDSNRQPKLAYDAFKAARRKLGAAFFQYRLSDGETGSSAVEAYLFQGTSTLFYVVWANGTRARQVRLPGQIARVSGLLDETLAEVLDVDDGKADGLITVTAGIDPIYVDIIK
jgi:hypothetical protein